MSTIDSKEIIKDLLLNNGYYETDPQVFSVWSYTNSWGKRTCAIFYHEGENDLEVSPFVSDPELLWHRLMGISKAGRKWLEENA